MTLNVSSSQPDYLVIGHVAKDIVQEGYTLGGTAAYSGLTAHALGMNTGIVTATSPDLNLQSLEQLQVLSIPSDQTTCFKNRYKQSGRAQTLHARAAVLSMESIPPSWTMPRIVHFAPIANEIDPDMPYQFASSIIAMTPQGWLRRWDDEGAVRLEKWTLLRELLPAADIVVLSEEDIEGDLEAARELATYCKLLALTRGPLGARIFWKDEVRDIPAPEVEEVEPTGAGDIFAAAFFIHWAQMRDAWQAARFANQIASSSVTRCGLDSIPQPLQHLSPLTEES